LLDTKIKQECNVGYELSNCETCHGSQTVQIDAVTVTLISKRRVEEAIGDDVSS